jgi:hypothetical protein
MGKYITCNHYWFVFGSVAVILIFKSSSTTLAEVRDRVEKLKKLNTPMKRDEELGLYVEGAIAALDLALAAIDEVSVDG